MYAKVNATVHVRPRGMNQGCASFSLPTFLIEVGNEDEDVTLKVMRILDSPEYYEDGDEDVSVAILVDYVDLVEREKDAPQVDNKSDWKEYYNFERGLPESDVGLDGSCRGFGIHQPTYEERDHPAVDDVTYEIRGDKGVGYAVFRSSDGLRDCGWILRETAEDAVKVYKQYPNMFGYNAQTANCARNIVDDEEEASRKVTYAYKYDSDRQRWFAVRFPDHKVDCGWDTVRDVEMAVTVYRRHPEIFGTRSQWRVRELYIAYAKSP